MISTPHPLRTRPHLLALAALAIIFVGGASGCSKKRCETVKRADWPLAEQLASQLGETGKLCSIEKALTRSTSRFHQAPLAAKFENDAKSRAEMAALIDRVVAMLAKQGFAPDPKRTHRDRIVTAPARPARPYARDASSGTLMRYLVDKNGSSVINVMAFFMPKSETAIIQLFRLEGPANIVRRPAAGRKRLATFAAAVKRTMASEVDQRAAPKSCSGKPRLAVFTKPKVLSWRISRPLVLDAEGAEAFEKPGRKTMAIGEFNLLDQQLGRLEGGHIALYRKIKQTKRKRFRATSSRSLGSGMRLARGRKYTQITETGQVRVARAATGEVVYAGKLSFVRKSRNAGLEAALKRKLRSCPDLEVLFWDHKRARVK
jgi:hypothetical protein